MAQAKTREPWIPEPTTFATEDDSKEVDRGDTVGLGETPTPKEESVEEVAEKPPEIPVKEEQSDEPKNEETKEEPDTEEANSEPETKKEPILIPKERLDAELAKKRQLENRVKELEKRTAEKPKQVEFDFDKAEKLYMDAVIDGKTQDAQKIRQDIRKAERQQMELDFAERMNTTSQQTQDQINLEREVERIITDRPDLDINSPKANSSLIDETNELMTAFLNTGYNAVDALKKAVGYTTNSVGLNNDGPAVIPSPQTAKRNTELELKRKAEAAAKQPPKLGGESSRHQDELVKSAVNMSRDEFAQLSNEELRKLRGDFG